MNKDCGYEYKGKTFANITELEDYIKSNPQEFTNSLKNVPLDNINQDSKTEISQERLNQIEDLFNENPELANNVYEALGFGQESNLKPVNKEIPFNYGNNKELVLNGDKTITSRNFKFIPNLQVGESGLQVIDGVPFKITYHGELKHSEVKDKVGIDYSVGEAFVKTTKGKPTEKATEDFIKGIGTKHIYQLQRINNQLTPQQKQQAQQLYSQYLDTIFPDSKVKDIVYHGTDAQFDKFDKSFYQSGADYIYFGKLNTPGFKHLSRTISVIINLINPSTFIDNNTNKVKNDDGFIEEYSKNFIQSLTEEQFEYGEFLNQYGVRNPEQIHILGSQADVQGFKDFVEKQQNKKGYDPSMLKDRGLIVTPNFDPSVGLKSERFEDGTLKYAQVFVASKFKVYNSETGKFDYINLQDYVLPGTSTIDTSKLPEELLSMFSFRIPTSSHQSGTIIEIAGFLPHSVGDLMIVPKDHTVQIGEDYDIDTRYMYQYNYFKTPDGSLKKFDYSDIEAVEGSYETIRKEYLDAKDALWNEYYKEIPNTTEGENTTLKPTIVVTKNPFYEANKATLLELTFMRDALTNFDTDTYWKEIFKETYDVDHITKGFLKDKIKELEDQLIPRGITAMANKQLKEDYREIKEGLYKTYTENKTDFNSKVKHYSTAIKQKGNELKVIENNLISMYKSVFSSPSEEVRQLITKVLSTDFAEDTAQLIAESSEEIDPNYTIFDPLLQQKVMKAGADGKLGIGVHSNAVTFNSLLQQLDEPLYLLDKDIDKETDKVVFTRQQIILGNLNFSASLGEILDRANSKRQSEHLMISQNSATDNQKLEIMSRRNENAETINVFSMLQLLGADNDGTTVDGKEVSYASLFISQPVIQEYVKQVKGYKASTSKDFVPRPDMAASIYVEKELEKVIPHKYWQIDRTTRLPDIGFLAPGVSDFISKKLTGDNLIAMLGKPLNELTGEEAVMQYVLLRHFNRLKGNAATINTLQKFINIENGGLGISFYDTIDLKDSLRSLRKTAIGTGDNPEMPDGFEKLIGDIVELEDPNETYYDEGYVKVFSDEKGSLFIKPNNHYAHKIVTAISMGYNLWKNIFPYDDPTIKSIVNDAIKNAGINPDSSLAREFKYKIISEMKEYSLSDSKTLFPDGSDKSRQELFFDTDTNESLGSYLHRLKAAKHPFMNLPFFKDLSIEINREDFPTLIKYNTGDMSIENTIRINNLIQGLQDSTRELPLKRNGKTVTEGELIGELFRYAILADQGNGATGFRKMLPMSLFSKYKVDASLRSKNNVMNARQVNAFYNGPINSLEKLLGSRIDDEGNIFIKNRDVSTQQVVRTLQLLNRVHTQDGGEPPFIFKGNKVEVNIPHTNISKSTFERQFFQHNPELIGNSYKGSGIKNLSELTGMSEEDLAQGNVEAFSISSKGLSPYLTVVSPTGEIFLYEAYQEFNTGKDDLSTLKYYRRIPVLGVHGMNEYNPRQELIKKSSVSKFNMKNTQPKHITKLSDYVVTEDKTREAVDILKDLLADNPSNRYYDTIQYFKGFLNQMDFKNANIEVVDGMKGAASYNPETNTIKIAKATLENATKEQLQDIFMEEIIHFVTVNSMSRYIQFTGVSSEGRPSYKIVSEDGKIPAELQTLLNIYMKAFSHLSKKFGKDKFEKLVRSWVEKTQNKKGENNSLANISGEIGEVAYAVKDIHEFIAGIFIKDKAFAKEMASTEYMKSGKSMLQKFSESLVRLLQRMIPGMKKDSYSSNVVENLTKFLLTEKDNLMAKIVSPTDLGDTPNTQFAKTLLEQNIEEEISIGEEVTENDVSLLDNEADCIF